MYTVVPMKSRAATVSRAQATRLSPMTAEMPPKNSTTAKTVDAS